MDFTKLLYDQGIYDPIDARQPVFTKPIWRTLVHQCRSADDRIRILNAKTFNVAGNPNILPGIYTRPDVWITETDDWKPEDVRSIKFVTRQCRFTHNAADRPIEALLGNGSVWWNRLWCTAIADVGFHIEPISAVAELPKWSQREDTIKASRHILDFDGRKPFTKALMQGLLEAGVDILGQGGEFIILNQSVIDWESTREASDFETAHKRRFNVIASNMEQACAEIRELVLELRRTAPNAMIHVKPLPSRNALALTPVMMDREMFADTLPRLETIAAKFKLKIALDDNSSGVNPKDVGFNNEHTGYFFKH